LIFALKTTRTHQTCHALIVRPRLPLKGRPRLAKRSEVPEGGEENVKSQTCPERSRRIENVIRVNPYLNVGRSSVRRGQYLCPVVDDEARGKACFASGLRQEHITG